MSKPMLPSLGQEAYKALLRYRQTPEEAVCMQEISHQVRDLRAAHQLTRDELAKQLGIDRELLVIVENGDGNPEIARQILKMSLLKFSSPTV